MMSRLATCVIFAVLWTMGTHGKPSDSGDEPYYLIASRSLLVDHDLDLKNNFDHNEGGLIGADDLASGAHARIAKDGAFRSVHDVGLSALIAPVLAVGTIAGNAMPAVALKRVRLSRGRFAYTVVSAFMVSLTALGASLFFVVVRRRSSALAANALTCAVFLSPPVMSHAFLVFPEIPMLLVVCAVLYFYADRQTTRPAWAPVVCALLLGLSPWLHRKFSFLAIGLFGLVLAAYWQESRRSWKGAAVLLAAFAAPQIAFHATTMAWWGTVGGPQLDSFPFSVAGIPVGATGMFIDRTRGLLAYAPIYLLLPIIWFGPGRRYLAWLIPVGLLFVPMAAFVTWDAGYSPAARFMVPLMPMLALPARDLIQLKWFQRVALVPVAIQVLFSGYAWAHPRALWPGADGRNRLLAAFPAGNAVEAVLPQLFKQPPQQPQ